jgi:hypothetical protein
MKVVQATGAYGSIKNAILSAEVAIARIEVTQEEMDEFVSMPQFAMPNIDKNYGGYEIQVPLGVKTHHGSTKVKSCWYMQTFIIVV